MTFTCVFSSLVKRIIIFYLSILKGSTYDNISKWNRTLPFKFDQWCQHIHVFFAIGLYSLNFYDLFDEKKKHSALSVGIDDISLDKRKWEVALNHISRYRPYFKRLTILVEVVADLVRWKGWLIYSLEVWIPIPPKGLTTLFSGRVD